MTKTTTLTLNVDHLQRLLDGMEGLAEPLPLEVTDHGREPLADYQEHEALICRLRTALTRVQS